MKNLKILYDMLENIPHNNDLYEIESSFFMALYDIPKDKKIPAVTAYITIFNWFSNSLRSGVWTYYETAYFSDLCITEKYLRDNNFIEFADIFAYGIHDYQNPKYAENYDYPPEWIEQSEKIDFWIYEHENFLYDWQLNLLKENKNLILQNYAK